MHIAHSKKFWVGPSLSPSLVRRDDAASVLSSRAFPCSLIYRARLSFSLNSGFPSGLGYLTSIFSLISYALYRFPTLSLNRKDQG